MSRSFDAAVEVRRGERTSAVRRGQAGAVTAETAMVLPVLASITIALVWLVALAATQARVVDAAREVARALAREEDKAAALTLGRRVAPDGARFRVQSSDGEVRVRVTAQVPGPDGLVRFVSRAVLHAEAVAATESR
jgi:Flp pilus assembly protein TadG